MRFGIEWICPTCGKLRGFSIGTDTTESLGQAYQAMWVTARRHYELLHDDLEVPEVFDVKIGNKELMHNSGT